MTAASRALGIAALLLASTAALGAQSSAIVGATVITMDGGRVLRDATVLIRDGRIVAVGPRATVQPPPGAEIVDGRGKFVMPGLTDMHVHLHADDTLPDAVAADELGVMLAHGITTARLMIGRPFHFELRREVMRGAVAGPRLLIASPELSGQETPLGIRVQTPDEARAAVRRVAADGYDFVKVTTDITPEVYEAIVAEAAAQDLRVVGHVDPRVGARRAIAARQQIEHLDAFMEEVLHDSVVSRESVSDVGAYRTARWASLDHVDDRKVQALAGLVARSGVPVDPTLVFFRSWFGEWPAEAEIEARPDYAFIPVASRGPWLRTLVAMRRNPPSEARRARYIQVRNAMVKAIVDSGGAVMAGSDAPGGLMTYGWMLHRELLALRDAGLTPEQVLAAATTVPAAYIGEPSEAAQVKEGMRADLLVLDADPLADIANTQRIAYVVSGGRWYDRAAREAMLARARERLSAAP
jgi:imidazolonepropionase-like amidohydrolase